MADPREEGGGATPSLVHPQAALGCWPGLQDGTSAASSKGALAEPDRGSRPAAGELAGAPTRGRGGVPTAPVPPFHLETASWPPLGAGPSAASLRSAPSGQIPTSGPAAGALIPATSEGSSPGSRGPGHGTILPPILQFGQSPNAGPNATYDPALFTSATVHSRPSISPAVADGLPANRSIPDGTAEALRDLQAGGPPSFAQILLRSFRPPSAAIPVHPPARTDGGEPAAFFTAEEISQSCGPLRTAVIARTPRGRPPFPEIRAHLAQRFKLQHDFVISSLDKRHLLIRFQNDKDFLQVLLKQSMLVQGRPFRFFRWTMDFSPETDSPVVPLWIELQQLPANFYTEPMIRSIAGSIGPLLKIDANTLSLACTQGARINVQLDVSRPLPDRVWIGYGPKGFWQPITYLDVPLYCSGCKRLGHHLSTCKTFTPRSNQQDGDHAGPDPPSSSAHQAGEDGPGYAAKTGAAQPAKMRWRPITITGAPVAPKGDQQTPTVVIQAVTVSAQPVLDRIPNQNRPPIASSPDPVAAVGGFNTAPAEVLHPQMTSSAISFDSPPKPVTMVSRAAAPSHQAAPAPPVLVVMPHSGGLQPTAPVMTQQVVSSDASTSGGDEQQPSNPVTAHPIATSALLPIPMSHIATPGRTEPHQDLQTPEVTVPVAAGPSPVEADAPISHAADTAIPKMLDRTPQPEIQQVDAAVQHHRPPSECTLMDEMVAGIDSLAITTPIAGEGGETISAQVSPLPLPSSQPVACQVFGEMPNPVTEAAAATTSRAQPPLLHDSDHATQSEVTAARDQSACPPAQAAPSADSPPRGAPAAHAVPSAPDAAGGATPLNANAPPWTAHSADRPISFPSVAVRQMFDEASPEMQQTMTAVLRSHQAQEGIPDSYWDTPSQPPRSRGRGRARARPPQQQVAPNVPNVMSGALFGSPSGYDTSVSPPSPRASFAEVVRQNPVQDTAHTPPGVKKPAGRHIICLPVVQKDALIPETSTKPSTGDEDQQALRNAWVGRTRSTAAPAVDPGSDQA